MDSDIEVAYAMPAVEPSRPSRWRRLEPWKMTALVAAGAAVFMGATFGVTLLLIPDPVTIAGQLVLTDKSLDAAAGAACAGRGEYSDIRRGAQVVITDETGTTMALADLGQGRSVGTNMCSFPFTVPDLPGRSFYGVEIGNRVKVQFTPEQVAGPITLTLGA